MRGALQDLNGLVRYVTGLPRTLRQPVTSAQAREKVAEQQRTRDDAFLRCLERTVYEQPHSPYLALLRHAGVELGDANALVREHGLDGALERLHDLGVYVTLEEFKGRRPIERPGLTLQTRPADFDGPLLGAAYASRTGGSTGRPRRVMTDLRSRDDQAMYHRLFVQSFRLEGAPTGFWRSAPPGNAGLGGVLGFAKAGIAVERWFSQSNPAIRRGLLKDTVFTRASVLMARLAGAEVPYPEYVPVSDATPVAAWLAAKTRAGTPALLSTTPSSAVRVCQAAERGGLDVSGTVCRLGGEPYTPGKAAVLERSGIRGVSNYTMSEAGRVGVACGNPHALDDLHLLTNSLGVIQRPRQVAEGESVGVLLFTSLRLHAPKVLINVESDDFATLERRECGCLLGELGLTLHASEIRSHEKLTGEGMTFFGSDLITLIDEVLPARFGGRPTDYQLVEEEEDGLPRVTLLVSPSVGEVDEAALLETVHAALAAGPGYRAMMAGVWREGQMIRVERREPFVTAGHKILPLHAATAARRTGSAG